MVHKKCSFEVQKNSVDRLNFETKVLDNILISKFCVLGPSQIVIEKGEPQKV